MVPEPPAAMLMLDLFRVIPGLEASASTVTMQDLTWLPSSVVTVISAVPADTPVTTPLSSTVATSVLLLAQLTFWLAASWGSTVAMSSFRSPTRRLVLLRFKLTPVTGFGVGSAGFSFTSTVQVAVFLTSSVVTVMIVLPGPFAVTIPSRTEATEGSSVLQLTVLLLASLGSTVASRLSCPPTSSFKVGEFRLTPVTDTVSVCPPLPSPISGLPPSPPRPGRRASAPPPGSGTAGRPNTGISSSSS